MTSPLLQPLTNPRIPDFLSPLSMTTNASKITVEFDDRSVRRFMIASIIWGIVGMLAGVFIASQLNFHQLNLTSWLSFGRLRPLHTNAVIFAFVGNMMFAGVYYSTQRLCKARMASASAPSLKCSVADR